MPCAAPAPGAAGKQLFLLTNSAFGFVDAGMRFLIGSDWRRRRRWNGPSTLSDGSAPSARLVAPTAQPARTDPRAHWFQQQRRDEHARECEKGPTSELAARSCFAARKLAVPA